MTAEYGFSWLCDKLKRLMLATDPGNQPVVRVRTAETVQFHSKPVHKPNLIYPGRANMDQYPATCGFFPGLARPASSNPQFQFSGLPIYGHIQLSYC